MDIDYPSRLVNQTSDVVTFDHITVSTTSKKEKLTTEKHEKLPCYMKVMSSIQEGTGTVLCKPAWQSGLKADEFLVWIDICKAHGIVIADAEPITNSKGNSLRIPLKGAPRHRLYTTLCCYRWADSLPKLPYMVAIMAEQKPDLAFWQVMHYAMQTHVWQTNHTFCSVAAGRPGSAYTGHAPTITNGLAAAWFFLPDSKGKIAADAHNENEYAIIAVDAFRRKHIPVQLPIEKEQILDPRLTPLYRKHHTYSGVRAAYDLVTKQKKKSCKK